MAGVMFYKDNKLPTWLQILVALPTRLDGHYCSPDPESHWTVHLWSLSLWLSPTLQGVLFLESSRPHLESLVFTFSRPDMYTWHPDSSWGSSNIIFHGLSLHFTQSSHTAIHLFPDDSIWHQPSYTGSRCFLFTKCPCPHPKPHLSKSLFFHTIQLVWKLPICLLLRILVAFVLSSRLPSLIILHDQVSARVSLASLCIKVNPPEPLAQYFRHARCFFKHSWMQGGRMWGQESKS